jgi:hypothetical protein
MNDNVFYHTFESAKKSDWQSLKPCRAGYAIVSSRSEGHAAGLIFTVYVPGRSLSRRDGSMIDWASLLESTGFIIGTVRPEGPHPRRRDLHQRRKTRAG